jgi:hypothetical protein
VVGVLVAEGFVRDAEAASAIDALATVGVIEKAILQAARMEAEEMLSEPSDEPPASDPG